jgi:hypothetical protein
MDQSSGGVVPAPSATANIERLEQAQLSWGVTRDHDGHPAPTCAGALGALPARA